MLWTVLLAACAHRAPAPAPVAQPTSVPDDALVWFARAVWAAEHGDIAERDRALVWAARWDANTPDGVLARDRIWASDAAATVSRAAALAEACARWPEHPDLKRAAAEVGVPCP
jgi:hypothetical protein